MWRLVVTSVSSLAISSMDFAIAQELPTSSGTGFFVNDSGAIVTNKHVVEGCSSVLVDGFGRAESVILDSDKDLALIKVATALSKPLQLSPDEPRNGEEVIALGYPLTGVLSDGLKITVGNVNSLSGLRDDNSFLQHSAPIQFGNSGGPLLDRSGRTVGVNTSLLNNNRVPTQNVNFAIKAGIVETFLISNNIEYVINYENKPLAQVADVFEIAKSSTVRIFCYGGTSAQAKERWNLYTYGGVDFWGGDKYPKGVKAQGAAECAAICALDSQCKVFTFSEKRQCCYVKTKIDIVVESDGILSGLIAKDEEDAPKKDQDIYSEFTASPGSEFYGVTMPFWQPGRRITSLDACLRHCAADDSCNWVTFDSKESGARSCRVWRFKVDGSRGKSSAYSFSRQLRRVQPLTEPAPLELQRGQVVPELTECGKN